MIVSLKKLLAKEISSILERAKIITSDFDEASANKAQSSQEVRVTYQKSSWNRKVRIYEYLITLKIKDIRSDDTVQNLVDKVCYGLLGVKRFLGHLEIASDSNEGFLNGLWEYQIQINLSYQADDSMIDCISDDPILYRDFQVFLYPSLESDLGLPDGNDRILLVP